MFLIYLFLAAAETAAARSRCIRSKGEGGREVYLRPQNAGQEPRRVCLSVVPCLCCGVSPGYPRAGAGVALRLPRGAPWRRRVPAQSPADLSCQSFHACCVCGTSWVPLEDPRHTPGDTPGILLGYPRDTPGVPPGTPSVTPVCPRSSMPGPRRITNLRGHCGSL